MWIGIVKMFRNSFAFRKVNPGCGSGQAPIEMGLLALRIFLDYFFEKIQFSVDTCMGHWYVQVDLINPGEFLRTCCNWGGKK